MPPATAAASTAHIATARVPQLRATLGLPGLGSGASCAAPSSCRPGSAGRVWPSHTLVPDGFPCPGWDHRPFLGGQGAAGGAIVPSLTRSCQTTGGGVPRPEVASTAAPARTAPTPTAAATSPARPRRDSVVHLACSVPIRPIRQILDRF